MTFFDNKILAAEHGPQGGDEINLVSTDAVKNYGWYLHMGFTIQTI